MEYETRCRVSAHTFHLVRKAWAHALGARQPVRDTVRVYASGVRTRQVLGSDRVVAQHKASLSYRREGPVKVSHSYEHTYVLAAPDPSEAAAVVRYRVRWTYRPAPGLTLDLTVVNGRDYEVEVEFERASDEERAVAFLHKLLAEHSWPREIIARFNRLFLGATRQDRRPPAEYLLAKFNNPVTCTAALPASEYIECTKHDGTRRFLFVEPHAAWLVTASTVERHTAAGYCPNSIYDVEEVGADILPLDVLVLQGRDVGCLPTSERLRLLPAARPTGAGSEEGPADGVVFKPLMGDYRAPCYKLKPNATVDLLCVPCGVVPGIVNRYTLYAQSADGPVPYRDWVWVDRDGVFVFADASRESEVTMVAEFEVHGGVPVFLRHRPDKLEPNFVSVVDSNIC